MNALQLIKARTTKNRAIQLARLQMAKAFRNPDYTDLAHTPMGEERKTQRLYRGIPYDNISGDQHATKGRELRYRGVRYGMY